MRAILVAAAGLLVACSDPPGATLEVVPMGPGVKSIELFVGGDCGDCPDAMSPPGMLPRRTNIAIVDDTAVFLAEMRGDHGLFRLESKDDRDEYVPLMIAVGYNDSHDAIEVGIVRSATIPAGRAEYWKTFLVTTTPIVDPAPDDTNDRTTIWPADRPDRNGHPRCVMVQHGKYNTDAVVPADDTDCDGVPAASECAPFTPSANGVAPRIEQTSCVRPVAPAGGSAGNPLLCMLGAPICSELGTVPMSPCELLDVDYCAPSFFCGNCTTWDCVTTALGTLDPTSDAVSHAACKVPMTSTGDDCSPSQRTDTELDLSALLAGSNGAKCRSVHIHDLTRPLKFGDEAPVGNGTFSARLVEDNCKVAVNWDGPYGHALPAAGTTVTLLADVELDNNKHIVLPIMLALGGCADPMACGLQLAPGESMLACNREAKDTTTCGSTTSGCPNNTVACGARCCGYGEACRDGACVCGDGSHCAENVGCGGGGIVGTPGACGTGCCNQFAEICQ